MRCTVKLACLSSPRKQDGPCALRGPSREALCAFASARVHLCKVNWSFTKHTHENCRKPAQFLRVLASRSVSFLRRRRRRLRSDHLLRTHQVPAVATTWASSTFSGRSSWERLTPRPRRLRTRPAAWSGMPSANVLGCTGMKRVPRRQVRRRDGRLWSKSSPAVGSSTSRWEHLSERPGFRRRFEIALGPSLPAKCCSLRWKAQALRASSSSSTGIPRTDRGTGWT